MGTTSTRTAEMVVQDHLDNIHGSLRRLNIARHDVKVTWDEVAGWALFRAVLTNGSVVERRFSGHVDTRHRYLANLHDIALWLRSLIVAVKGIVAKAEAQARIDVFAGNTTEEKRA